MRTKHDKITYKKDIIDKTDYSLERLKFPKTTIKIIKRNVAEHLRS